MIKFIQIRLGNDPNKSNPSNIGGNDTFKRDNENKGNCLKLFIKISSITIIKFFT